MTSDTRSLKEILSPRQLEVLALMAEGLDNYQIADQLFVSIKFVGNCINAIYSELCPGARSAAAKRVLVVRRYLLGHEYDADVFAAALELCKATDAVGKRRASLHQAMMTHDQAQAQWERIITPTSPFPIPPSCLPNLDGYTVSQAARIIGVQPSTVNKWIRQGLLNAVKTPVTGIPGHHTLLRVPHEDLLDFLRRTDRTPRYDIEAAAPEAVGVRA